MIYLPHRRKAFRSSAYVANAVESDGTNDYLSRTLDLSGSVDSKIVLMSVWFKRGAINSNQYIFSNYATLTGVSCDIQSNNTFRCRGRSSSDAAIFNVVSTSTFTDSAWHNVLLSLDLSDASKRSLFIDGASEAATWSIYSNFAVDFTRSTWSVMCLGDASKTLRWNGDMSELWLSCFEPSYFDISVQANREKFRSSAGKPVSLGTDGSTPTGTKPLIYLKSNASNFGTNATGYGDFTITGSLTDVTPP